MKGKEADERLVKQLEFLLAFKKPATHLEKSDYDCQLNIFKTRISARTQRHAWVDISIDCKICEDCGFIRIKKQNSTGPMKYDFVFNKKKINIPMLCAGKEEY